MRLLPDTHLLIGYAGTSEQETLERWSKAFDLLESPENEVLFSSISIWEVAIKFARGMPDFTMPPSLLRRALIGAGFQELAMTAAHAERVIGLPSIHKDPFDRLLLAQAIEEDILLVTGDRTLSKYPGPILRV